MSDVEVTLTTTEEEEDADEFFRSRNPFKARRQKYCVHWEKEFPWLTANNVDRALGMCTICNQQLVCKKSHLERHQRSLKHRRSLGVDLFESEDMKCRNEMADGEENEELLSMSQREVMQSSTALEVERVNSLAKNELKHMKSEKLKFCPESDSKLNMIRTKLLQRIRQERRDLHEYYRMAAIPSPAPPPVARDGLDLFFDSISANVRTFPPKLLVEVKSRISQLVSEYEMRALSEREDSKNSKAAESPKIVVSTSSTTHGEEPINGDLCDEGEVIYSFQAS